MQLQRVAVTGIGAICGLGNSLEEVWANAIAGKPGVTKIERQDTTDWPVQIAGEVKNFKLDPALMELKDQDRFDLFNQYALHAGSEAIRMAGLTDAPYSKGRIGICLGTGLGGFPDIEKQNKIFLEKGHRRVSPFFIPSVIPNMAPGLMAIHYGFRGFNFSVASACASSAHAIGVAAAEIMLGRHDAIITGGTEAVVTPLTLAGFNSMKAVSRRNEEPGRASRPFDSGRDGFVMGEGAGIIVLENLEKAKARGARIIAEVVGWGASDDAYHFTAPLPDGEGFVQCMTQAMEQAGVKPQDIGYVNAHGTSTPQGDIAETKAVKKVFGDYAKNGLLVSSTKSMTGHLLGAAGGLECIMCIKALETGIVPPTINLENQDPECDLDYVPNKARKKDIKYALNNSFGFGGTNASTLFKKYQA